MENKSIKLPKVKEVNINVDYSDYTQFLKLLTVMDINTCNIKDNKVRISFKDRNNYERIFTLLQNRFISMKRLYQLVWNNIESNKYTLVGRTLSENLPNEIKDKVRFFFSFFPISNLRSKLISIRYENNRSSNSLRCSMLKVNFEEYTVYIHCIGDTNYIELTDIKDNRILASIQMNRKEYLFLYNNEKNDNIDIGNFKYIYNDDSKNVINITKNKEIVLQPTKSVNHLSLYYLNEISK